MNMLSLVLRILGIAGGILAGAAWFITNGALQDKQTLLDTEKTQHKATRSELADVKEKAIHLESDLKLIRIDLAAQKQEVNQFQNQYYEASQEINRLQASLESEQELAERLSMDNHRLKHEILMVKSVPPPDIDNSDEVLGYKRKIEDLEAEIQELQGRLRGAPVMVSTHPTTSAVKATRFQVDAMVAAIKPESGLIVVNRGFDSGLRKMSEYSLLRNGTEVGRFRVTVIDSAMSAGSIHGNGDLSNRLRTGDSIVIVQ